MGSSDNVQSFKVAATLSAQRIVAPASTAYQCQYPADAQNIPYGITIDDVTDTNQAIPVQVSGRAKLYFNDSCTTGQLVAADSSGRGIPFTMPDTATAATLPSAYVGILVGPTVDATGTIAEVHIAPGFIRGS